MHTAQQHAVESSNGITPPSEADPAAEVFDICDDKGNVTGKEARSVVHKTGLLHKAVYCFVYDSKGRLLVQRRSSAKSIGPNQWDMSVAEHLSPGLHCVLHQ